MIDFGIALDVTPVMNYPYFQEYYDKGATPLSDRTGGENQQTEIVGFKPPSIQRVAGSTPTPFDLRQPPNTQAIGYAEPVQQSPIDAAGESRTALLVQKYEGNFTREDNARLRF